MNRRLVLLLLFAASLFLVCLPRADAQVVVIASAGVKGSEFSASGPVLLRQCGAHDEFLNRYIGKSYSALRATPHDGVKTMAVR